MNGNHVNLLPASYRRRLAIRKLALSWVSLAILLLVVCSMVTNWVKLTVANTAARVAELRFSGEQVEDLMVANDDIKKQLQHLQFLNAHLTAMVPSDDLLQTLGAVAMVKLAEAKEGAKVRGLKMNLRQAKIAQLEAAGESSLQHVSYQARGGNASRGTSANSHLQISLLGTDQGQIQQWMQAFANSPRVGRVELGQAGVDAHGGGYQAEIQAQVVVEKELP